MEDEQYEEFAEYWRGVVGCGVWVIWGVFAHWVFWSGVADVPGESLEEQLTRVLEGQERVSLRVLGAMCLAYDIVMGVIGVLLLFDVLLRMAFKWKKGREKRARDEEGKKNGYQLVEGE